MKKINFKLFTLIMFAVLMLSSCASKKKASLKDGVLIENAELKKQEKELFGKIRANAVTNDALSSKMKFAVEAGGRSISVAGQFEMKNDKYIRIRLVPLGLFEVGMLEFTQDYVLVLDRMHKEYIKASYSQVPFLQANGVDFNALQSLFRNTIFVPGERNTDANSYKKFEMKRSGSQAVLTTTKGNLKYDWFVSILTGMIHKTEFTYISDGSVSRLDCSYADFEKVSGKMFPHKISLHFTTNLSKEFGDVTLTVSAKKIKAEQKGDGEVSGIPRRYKEIDVEKMFNTILENQ